MTEKYFQVSGRSMEPALFGGDIIEIISPEYQDGDIVVALAGDKTIVKRVSGDWLTGDNCTISAAFKLTDVMVLGKAVKTLKPSPSAHLGKAEAATEFQEGLYPGSSYSVVGAPNTLGTKFKVNKKIKITKASVSVNQIGSGTTTLTIGLWNVSTNDLIAQASAVFSTGGGGNLGVTFAEPINILPDTEYYIGAYQDNAIHYETYQPVTDATRTNGTSKVTFSYTTGFKNALAGLNIPTVRDVNYNLLFFIIYVINEDPTITISSPSPNQSFSAVFPIVYKVSDADGDSLTVTEKLNGATLRTITNATKDTDTTTQIPSSNWNNLAVSTQHTFSITADDGNGGITTANLAFTKINAVPVITGTDGSLGDKNAPFTYTYQVSDTDNDQVDVTEKLNGNVLRTIENIDQGVDYQVTISSANFYNIPVNGTATIQIVAVDAIGNTSYRNVTFKRVNAAAVLTCATADALGTITDPPSLTVQVSDPEGDVITLTAALDGTIIQTVSPATPNSDITVAIPHATWIATTLGQHTLKVRATDSNGAYSERTFTFTRADDRVQFETAEAILTTAMATKIVPAINAIVPEGSALAVEVCNNGFDDEPTWEDATAKTLERKAYTFINDAKTAQDWGIKMRITLKKWTAEVASLEVAAAPTASGNVTVTLNGVDTTVAVDPATDTTTDAVATKIRGASYDGWTTGGIGATVNFTATTPGNKTDASYSPGATGATGTMTTVTQGTNPTASECAVMGYGAAYE